MFRSVRALPFLTRKRHAVSRDDIYRVQERFSVIELCLIEARVLACFRR